MSHETLEAIGRLLKPHGVRGEILFLPYVDDLDLLPDLVAREVMLQHRSAPPQRRTIESWRWRGDKMVMRFEHCADRDEAASLRDYEILIPQHLFPELPEGEYYWYEIEGLAVYASDGRYLGTITEIIYTGSNDVYVVRHDTREVLVPALQEVIRSIDIERGEVHLYAVEGLLD